MTHGTIPRSIMPTRIAVYPGPTIKAWKDGVEVLHAILTPEEASDLAAQLMIAKHIAGPVYEAAPHTDEEDGA